MDKPRPTHRPREGWEEQFRKMHELGDDRLIDDSPTTDPSMPTGTLGLKEVAELASRLPPEDQVRLVASIGQQLGATLSTAQSQEAVSESPSLAILRAMHAEPHLSNEDVDELERMITSGRL